LRRCFSTVERAIERLIVKLSIQAVRFAFDAVLIFAYRQINRRRAAAELSSGRQRP